MRIHRTGRVVGLLGLWAIPAFLPGYLGAQVVRADKTAKIEALFSDIHRPDRPGLALGISEGGEQVFTKGFGMANLETGAVFRPETVSDIGSVAKQVTCLGIVLLAQEGKLSLDDDIRKYFPAAPDVVAPVRIRHLIHHVSGLREVYAMLELSGWKSGDGIRQEHAYDLLEHAEGLNFAPGERYSYCNTAYMLLGEIIRKVSGERFETWMRDRIFKPLGMDHTYIMDIQGEIFPNCAESYGPILPKGWSKIYDNSTAYGQGGVYSTIPDMLRWADNFRTARVGGPQGIAQMLQRGVLNNGDTLEYAFGIEELRYRGLRILQHTGSSAGYRAVITLVPGSEIAIVLKSNYAVFNSVKATEQILDILFEGSLEAPAPARPPVPPARPAVIPLDTRVVAGYLGSYHAPELETTFDVWQAEGKLAFGSRRWGRALMDPVGSDRFVCDGLPEIQFERDKKGNVRALRFSNGELQGVLMKKI
ncbi:MAG: serine hydrolase domain-containing protein [Haliscomenobacter sp.]